LVVTDSIWRFVKGFGLARALVFLLGELPLWFFLWPESGQLALGQHAYRTVQQDEPKAHFVVSSQLKGEASFSEGNKRYWYLSFYRQQHKVWSWWGTASLFSEPKVWIEPGQEFPRVLTYQPLILIGPETPLGRVISGHRLWTFDGERYRDREVPVGWLNLLWRSPFPVQD